MAKALADVDTAATPQDADELSRARILNALVGFGAAILAALLVLVVLYRWYTHGRDPIYVDDNSILMPAPPDGLTVGLGHERGLEAATGVKRDLAVSQVGLHVEEDDQAVVEALAADALLVHERQGVVVGQLDRVALRLDLGVDGHLGARSSFDRLDRLLSFRDGPGREDAGVVVDTLPGDGIRVWRPGGRRCRHRRACREKEEEPDRNARQPGKTQSPATPHGYLPIG